MVDLLVVSKIIRPTTSARTTTVSERITLPCALNQTAQNAPETFRMPKRGGDPYFGLTRGFYYNLEKRNLIRLIRIRDRGKIRGIVLIPYDAVKKLIMEDQG
jgi:hypothetical protein